MTSLSASMSIPVATRPPLQQRLLAVAREGWRYGLVSAAALAGDTSAYALALQAGSPLAAAVALGFAIGLCVAYAGSVLWVFDQHRLHDRRAEFAAFAVIGLLGLLLTQASLWWLVAQQHWPAVPAKLLTAVGVFAFNFTLRKLLLFSRSSRS
jgi:putative flippase GtrA